MLNLLKALRQDENGVILSTEIVIIGSLLVIGLITGLTCLQKAVNGELQDVANAIGSLDQTYSFSAHHKTGFGGQCCAYTAGSSFYNCEHQGGEDCRDIVGCHPIGGPLHESHHGRHGDNCECRDNCECGHSHRCTNSEDHTSGECCEPVGDFGTCGSCGGTVGGCTACDYGYPLVPNGPRCLDTGVPNMKVTEWPSSSSDCPVDNDIRFHESEIIFEHAVPSAEPQPMPVPEIHALPVPVIPTASAVEQFGGGFNFPSHVW